MTQTSIRDHFVEPDEEKQPGGVPTEFAEHYLEELEIKYNWNEETLPYAYLFKLYMYRLARDERRYKYL